MNKDQFLEFDVEDSTETNIVAVNIKYIVSVSLDKYKHLSLENGDYVLADTKRNKKNIEQLLNTHKYL